MAGEVGHHEGHWITKVEKDNEVQYGSAEVRGELQIGEKKFVQVGSLADQSWAYPTALANQGMNDSRRMNSFEVEAVRLAR